MDNLFTIYAVTVLDSGTHKRMFSCQPISIVMGAGTVPRKLVLLTSVNRFTAVNLFWHGQSLLGIEKILLC